uniref:USP domain-containing protein n=1 Tax=Trichobilharzia regenti TaxID=157069 RepID=A0AA85KF61_TRIRE|nr:unnamed protein product [Trichobilharzia regenti]
MDKLIAGVLISDHPESIKILLLRKLRDHVGKIDNTDSLKDAIVICITYIHENPGITDSFSNEVYSLLVSIEARLSDESIAYVSQKVTDSFGHNIPHSLPAILANYVKNIFKRHVMVCFQSVVRDTRQLISLHAGLDNVLKHNLMDNDEQLYLCVQHTLDNLSTHEMGGYDISDENYLDLVSKMFQILLGLCSQVFLENISCNSLEAELAQCISRSIIKFAAQPSLSASSKLNAGVLSEHVNSLVQDVLVDTDNAYHYISVSSILSELQNFCPDNAVLSETICGFIDQLSQRHINTIESCFSVLRRLTAWLTWPEITTHRSALDIWLIGFQCEMFRRFSPKGSQFSVNFWSEFINWQLKFLLELMNRSQLPHESTINALAFLILCEEGRRDRCVYDTVSQLAPVLNKLISMYASDRLNESYRDILLRLYAVSRLLNVMITSESHLSKASALNRKFLTDLLGKFHSNFKDDDVDVWDSRSNIYKLEVLTKFASQAGIRIRKIWERWDLTSSVQLINTYPSISQKANRSVTGYSGLLNVGNTCYANAALQLLYHCSEFRRALLDFHRPYSSTSKIVTSCSSLSTNLSSYSQNSNVNSSNNLSLQAAHFCDNVHRSDNGSVPFGNEGSLHAHLFSLFHSLDTHQIPTVRDLRAVLTVTKPAHFVSGEQQDAAEYLNYLLDRLHEEELRCKRRKSLTLNTCSDSSSFMPNESTTPSINTCTVENPPFSYNINNQTCSSSNETTTKEDDKYGSNYDGPSSSVVARLFGGTLLRHTSCVECQHVSSSRQEQFTCLYVPLTKPKELLLYEEQSVKENSSFVNEIPESNDSDSTDDQIVEPGTDLSTLIQAHFTQIEHVASSTQCESCGKRTLQARTLKLQQLSSHVLICLNLFRYCRVKQTCSKIMHRVRIPERLSVTVSASNTETYAYNNNNNNTNGNANNDISTSKDSTSKSKCHSRTYSLQAMIVHSGVSISCGHYTCVAKVGMQWILFDDDNAGYTTLEDVYSEPLATPYLLLYSQVS